MDFISLVWFSSKCGNSFWVLSGQTSLMSPLADTLSFSRRLSSAVGSLEMLIESASSSALPLGSRVDGSGGGDGSEIGAFIVGRKKVRSQ